MSLHTQDLWIPRDDMAVLGRCSVDTIKRDAKKLKKAYASEGRTYEERTDDAGRVLVNAADFIRLDRIRPEDLATGTTPAESASSAPATSSPSSRCRSPTSPAAWTGPTPSSRTERSS